MEEKEVNISEQRTKLEWDNYIEYLIEAIDESNFMKRAENKPMQTTKHELESHVTSRAMHVRAAADIAKRIANSLGLNDQYIYASMLMHDAGHPFTAHDGEEIFTGIGEAYNVDYYHHNAKGVEVVISENICEKAINKIPNIKNRPELRKKLEDEFFYFLDVIVSHDGEAGAKEMNAKPEEYPDMKTAVYEKLRLSNSTNNYKFIAQTIEGRIAKYADVIAYLSTDIQDRFRLGIQRDFDDDYLEFLGDILSNDFAETKEEKIEIAKNIIEEIKEEKLMQLVSDARAVENKEVIQVSKEIIDEIYQKVEGYENLPYDEQAEKAEEVMEEYIKEYKKQQYIKDMSNEEKKFVNADIQKIREFTRKKLRMRSSVIEEVTNRVRETLIQDLLRESKSQGDLDFSNNMKRLFFKAKELNYKYVPDTKWDYLKKELPVATHKLVHMVALSLRKSGAIESKFYDKAMRKHVKDEKALEYLKTLDFVDDEKRAEFKKKYGIRGIRPGSSKFTSEGGKREKEKAIAELCNSTYHYVLDSGELFAIQYQNTFQAVENQVVSKVKNAIGRLPEAEAKKRKTHISFFDDKIANEEEYMREQLIKKYGDDVEKITDEQILEFAKPIVEREREKMEGKMAVQMAINYLSGMSDKAILTHARDIGFIDEEILNSSSRGSSEEDKKAFETKYDMSVEPDDNKEKNNVCNER